MLIACDLAETDDGEAQGSHDLFSVSLGLAASAGCMSYYWIVWQNKNRAGQGVFD
jgi:hypothetical protein